MKKKVLIILADGFEDVEAVAPMDVLDRAGVGVTLAGLEAKEVKSAHGIKVLADTTLDALTEEFDAVILPGGGGGAKKLSESEKVKNIITTMNDKGKVVAAICASPAWVLAPTGILNGKKATCYPGEEKAFPPEVKASNEAVVVDGNIVTSRGPGTALLFGLKLAEILVGKEVANTVKSKMLI
ncbi:DJ-1 family glyoxalase III [Candidatus Omnitrophota bacterium]